MKAYSQMSKEELLALKSDLEKAYDEFKAQGLKPVSYTHLDVYKRQGS